MVTNLLSFRKPYLMIFSVIVFFAGRIVTISVTRGKSLGQNSHTAAFVFNSHNLQEIAITHWQENGYMYIVW